VRKPITDIVYLVARDLSDGICVLDDNGAIQGARNNPQKIKRGGKPFQVRMRVVVLFYRSGIWRECLVCGAVMKCIRKSSMERHYLKQHGDKYAGLSGAERETKLHLLKARNSQDEISAFCDEVCTSLLFTVQ